jgi:hypothetical protein
MTRLGRDALFCWGLRRWQKAGKFPGMTSRLFLFLVVAMTVVAAPLPPVQPSVGPGGAEYRHARVRESRYGKGGTQYWLFEPQEPAATKAPLLLFLHGYSAMAPSAYRGWIEHLVRRGNVVIYPRYQETLLTPPAEFHQNTLAAVRAALVKLTEKGRTSPDLTRMAVAGHSAGAIGAIHYAATARAEGLPEPKAAVLIQPGQGPKWGVQLLPLDFTAKLPEGLRLVVAVGDADSIVGDVSARRVWRRTEEVRERAFVTVQSDAHGEPELRAGHLSPLSADAELADALDWYGWWRLLDLTCASAFSGEPLRLDPAMGAWSDGHPLRPLKVEYSAGP